jgi:gliding motility-associated-like protein
LDNSFDCTTSEITIGGTKTSTGSGITYKWEPGNNSGLSTTNAPQPVATQAGVFTIIVTDENSGCFAVDSVRLKDNQDRPKNAEIKMLEPTCYGYSNGSINIADIVGGQPPYMYSIDGKVFYETNFFSGLKAGSYQIVVRDANGCIWKSNLSINQPPQIEIELGDNLELNLGDSAHLLLNTNIAPDSIWWFDGKTLSCNNCPAPYASPQFTTDYKATIWDKNGCPQSDDITLFVNRQIPIYIPNGFSPGDKNNINDYWTIYANLDLVLKVDFARVYDRWGNQVFVNEDFIPNIPAEGWDGSFRGRPMNPAVYVYIVQVKLKDGTTKLYKGDLTLMK